MTLMCDVESGVSATIGNNIYLAGPMTGYPDYNYQAFAEYAEMWREEGHNIINPAENFGGIQTLPRRRYIVEAIELLAHNTKAIALMPGWELSEGARMEVSIAHTLGLPIYDARHPDKVRHLLVGPYGEPVSHSNPADEYVHGTGAEQTELPTPRLVTQTDEQEPWLLGSLRAYQEAAHVRGLKCRTGDPADCPGEEHALTPLTSTLGGFGFTGKVDGAGVKASMTDKSKPPLALVPTALHRAVGRSLGHGAAKYAPHNYRRGMLWSEPYSALQRHLTAWNDGEDIDADSGLSHLDNAAAMLSFLIEYVTHRDLYGHLDDRFKRPSAS